MRYDLQCDLGHCMTVIAIDREKQLACSLGIGDRSIVRHLWRQERTEQIPRRVRQQSGGRDRVTEYTACELQSTPRAFEIAPILDLPNCGEDVCGSDFGNRHTSDRNGEL